MVDAVDQGMAGQATSSPQSATTAAGPGRDCLIVFARYPETGQVKTRLIPALGAEQATQMHEAMTRRTLAAATAALLAGGIELQLRIAGSSVEEARALFGDYFDLRPQVGEHLGQRLDDAVCAAFAAGASRVIVIGTDCPQLDAMVLQQARQRLQTADVVLGPAIDGGYYLIGMRAYRPELFRGIAWGTGEVLQQTRRAAVDAGLKLTLLAELSDVDHVEDLIAWRRVAGALPWQSLDRPTLSLSVVIPAVDAAETVAAAVDSAIVDGTVEVIVVDGGSDDDTRQIAARHGARVITARRGRGRQMNAGAALANGQQLLFLHADSRLPPQFEQHLLATLERGYQAGAFRLEIASERRALRWIERGANLRARWLQLPYGDQAIFLPAETFYQLGGFRHLPLMEDFELCRRLSHSGRIGLAAAAVTTSPRRWHALGPLRTTLVNQCCVAAYLLGVPVHRLARWYRRRGSSRTDGVT